jgi:hypothetical protein
MGNEALIKATSKLPLEDVRFLSEGQSQQPFTSLKLLERLQPVVSKSSQSFLRGLFIKIDRILSHLELFALVFRTLAQADPTGAGLIWGSVLLLIQVRFVSCCIYSKLIRVCRLLAELIALSRTSSSSYMS